MTGKEFKEKLTRALEVGVGMALISYGSLWLTGQLDSKANDIFFLEQQRKNTVGMMTNITYLQDPEYGKGNPIAIVVQAENKDFTNISVSVYGEPKNDQQPGKAVSLIRRDGKWKVIAGDVIRKTK